jgi:hypothetical protein
MCVIAHVYVISRKKGFQFPITCAITHLYGFAHRNTNKKDQKYEALKKVKIPTKTTPII